MNRKGLTGVCLVAAALLPLASLRAAVIYDLVTDQSVYEAECGESVSVKVSLRETLTDGSPSELLGRGGLFSFDVALDVTTAPTDPAAATAVDANPNFNGAVNNVPPVVVIADRDLLELEGVEPVAVGANTYRVHLATFAIQAGNVLDEITVFSLTDFENLLTPGTDYNTYYWDDVLAQNPLDPVVTGTTFSVKVIPEPTALCVLGILSVGLLSRRRRM